MKTEKERKLLEQQFTLLNMMYKNLPVGIIIYDRCGLLLSVNQKNREIMGIPEDVELTGLNLFEEPHIPEYLKQELRAGRDVAYDLDYHFEAIKGYFHSESIGVKPLHVSISIIWDGESVDGYLLVNQDRTPLMEREHQLEQMAIKLMTVVNSMSSGVEIYNEQGILTDCNPYDLDLFGVKDKEDLINRNISLINNPNLPSKVVDSLLKGQDIELHIKYDFDQIKKSDYYPTQKSGFIYLDIKGSPMVTDTGTLIGFVLEMNDVTQSLLQARELSRTREEAILSNQMLNEIIDRIPEAMYIKDAQNGFKYLRANDGFCKLINQTRESVCGNTDFELFDEESALMYREYDERLVAGERLVAYDSTIMINGVKEYWHFSKSIIKTSNGKALILGISTNVTALQNINMALKKAKEEAERSDKLKSTFLANMSHEIRTPLNAIVGFSDLLLESDNAVNKVEYMKIIKANNELLLRLIGDILDLSKMETGMMDLHYETFDLAQMVNEMFIDFSQRMPSPDVQLLKDNPYDRCMVTLDKNRVKQVQTNFLINAIKYTPKGYIKMGYCCENGGVKLYVEDTGIGIAKDKHDKVFARFEKLDNFAQGTGLGLSICKMIAEISKGTIGFDSTKGEGSTFWVWLPTNTSTL